MNAKRGLIQGRFCFGFGSLRGVISVPPPPPRSVRFCPLVCPLSCGCALGGHGRMGAQDGSRAPPRAQARWYRVPVRHASRCTGSPPFGLFEGAPRPHAGLKGHALPRAAGGGPGDPYPGIGGRECRRRRWRVSCPLIGCAGLGGAAVFQGGWCLRARDGQGADAAQAEHRKLRAQRQGAGQQPAGGLGDAADGPGRRAQGTGGARHKGFVPLPGTHRSRVHIRGLVPTMLGWGHSPIG